MQTLLCHSNTAKKNSDNVYMTHVSGDVMWCLEEVFEAEAKEWLLALH